MCIRDSTYPGHYYITASKNGYKSSEVSIEIKPKETGETIEIILNILDDGRPPSSIQNLRATPGDGKIVLTWDKFDNLAGDFKNFNIYRSYSEISDVSQLTPIDTSITNPDVIQFIDNTIVNGVDYYYAITAEDIAGNESLQPALVGPVRGNSAPVISNIEVGQDDMGKARIKYDIFDNEQNKVFIELEYWNGNDWRKVENAIGIGFQNIGSGKVIVWEVRKDFPNYDGNIKIKIIADDKEKVNNITWKESRDFLVDTQPPTNLSLLINGGAEYTYNPVVNLTLSANGGSSGMKEMRFSNDSDLDGIADNWSEWEPYSPSKQNFVLTENEENPSNLRRVMVEFKDGAGNTSITFGEIKLTILGDANGDCVVAVSYTHLTLPTN